MEWRFGKLWSWELKLKWDLCSGPLFWVRPQHHEHTVPTEGPTQMTWMHRRSRHWHQLDHVITRSRDFSDFKVVPDSLAVWTDHKLPISYVQQHGNMRTNAIKSLMWKDLRTAQSLSTLREASENICTMQTWVTPQIETFNGPWSNIPCWKLAPLRLVSRQSNMKTV